MWIFMLSQFFLLTYRKSDCSLTMTKYKPDSPWGHFLKYIQCSRKCSAGLDTFTYPHMSGTQLVQSMLTIQKSYRAFPVCLWSCHGDCKLTCLFNNEAVFSTILLITLRAFLIDWNLSEHALHAFPSLSLSVCIVSLKIAIFLVKTHNCQRMSCVCVHNASSIVCFP